LPSAKSAVVRSATPTAPECAGARGRAICEHDPVIWTIDKQGDPVPILTVQWNRKITLHRGNVLAFDNFMGNTEPHRVNAYATKGKVKPCVPVEPASQDDSASP
jgi:hypothetical protein